MAAEEPMSTNWSAADKFLFASPFIGVFLGALLIALPVIIITSIPDKWDRATVVRVCRDGTKIFQMEDGEYRVKYSIRRSYHAAGPNVC